MTTRPRKQTPAKQTPPRAAQPAADRPPAPPEGNGAPDPAAGRQDGPGAAAAADVDAAGELDRLGQFLAGSYPAEARTDEGPVDTAIRLLDRARVVPPGGVDPASGEPYAAPPGEAAGAANAVSYTLTADDVADGRTLTDVADAMDVAPVQLLALNASILDAEAVARGLAHSDNGRIIFAGTVLHVPTD